MNVVDDARLNILDLPDEIFLMIFANLSAIDVFYSFGNVNQRLNRLVLDTHYIRDMNMTIDSIKNQISFKNARVLSKICQKNLRQIGHQIRKLTIEEDSLKVLHVTRYPQLYSLSLINFRVESLRESLTSMTLNFLSYGISRIRSK